MEQTRRIVHRMPSAEMFRTAQYTPPKKVVPHTPVCLRRKRNKRIVLSGR